MITKRKFSIKELAFLFCGITTSVLGLIAFLTVGPMTWQAIRQMQCKYLLLSLALGGIVISLDSVKLQVLSRAAGTKITFPFSLETTLLYFFVSSVTPTITGGEPLMIYMLNQKDMPLGKATTVIFLRGVLLLSMLAIAAPIIIYFHGELIRNTFIKGFFYYVAALLTLLVLFLIYSLFNPLKGEEIVHKMLQGLRRSKILGRYSERLEKKIKVWIDDFSSCLKEFMKYKRKALMWATLLTGGSLMANFSIAFTVLKGLNHTLPILQVFMIQFVLYFFLYFTPTPGGTGVAEGGGYLMFSSSIPTHVLGIFVILWRFFAIYVWVIIGGLLMTKTVGLDILDKISRP
ncbi:MAG: lysylphosphatidylglycerol synthase transmembrane domain-containing protein [bacterium]